MRRYSVLVTPQAQVSIREAFHYIYAQSPVNAERWLRQLYDKIETLENLPERCGYAREREYFEEELRQFVFKSHRVVFVVDHATATVHVLDVRHAKRTERPTIDQ